MRISIVTPSFNQARFLEQTIQSVLAQEPGPFEYFIIDGGSHDGSLEIIQRHASQLSGWVSEKDNGQAEAINKGLIQATGEIVAWINSDDYYLPGAFARAQQAFEQNPQAGLVYGNVLSVDADGKQFNLQRFRQVNLLDLMSFQIISQPAVFMRRSILQQAGLLDTSLHCLLDHQLWLRLARLAPMVYIPETLAAARYHAQAKNLARTTEFGREAFRITAWMADSPDFEAAFQQNKPKILAGAERFDAFYLLDGGNYAAALAAYRRAFKLQAPTALKDWHRIAYALLALMGLGKLRGLYTWLRKQLPRR